MMKTTKIKKNFALLSSCLLLGSALVLTAYSESPSDDNATANVATDTEITAAPADSATSEKPTAKLNYIVTSFNAVVSGPSDPDSMVYKVTLSKLPIDGLDYMSQSHQADEGNMDYPAFVKLWHSKDENSFMNKNPNGRITLSDAAIDAEMITIVGKITDVSYDEQTKSLDVTIKAFEDISTDSNTGLDFDKTYSFASLFIDYWMPF